MKGLVQKRLELKSVLKRCTEKEELERYRTHRVVTYCTDFIVILVKISKPDFLKKKIVLFNPLH